MMEFMAAKYLYSKFKAQNVMPTNIFDCTVHCISLCIPPNSMYS